MNDAVALNCWLVPRAMDAAAGDMAIETGTAGVTVKVVDPLTPLKVAVTVADPMPVLVASPDADALKTAGLLELQVTELVRSCVLRSV